MAHASRASCAGIFFLEDDLLPHAHITAAIFFGPADASPAALRHVLLPLFAQLGVGFIVAGAAALFQRGEFASEISSHPSSDFFAQRVVVSGIGADTSVAQLGNNGSGASVCSA